MTAHRRQASAIRTWLLRGNAFYIGVAGALGLVFDVRGVLYGLGPQGQVLADAPLAAIGFVEAHGLAVILAVLLMRAPSARSWHLTAAAMDLLLGISNLAFWQLFVVTDALVVGYVTTGLHWSFGLAHLAAAIAAATARGVVGRRGAAPAPASDAALRFEDFT